MFASTMASSTSAQSFPSECVVACNERLLARLKAAGDQMRSRRNVPDHQMRILWKAARSIASAPHALDSAEKVVQLRYVGQWVLKILREEIPKVQQEAFRASASSGAERPPPSAGASQRSVASPEVAPPAPRAPHTALLGAYLPRRGGAPWLALLSLRSCGGVYVTPEALVSAACSILRSEFAATDESAARSLPHRLGDLAKRRLLSASGRGDSRTFSLTESGAALADHLASAAPALQRAASAPPATPLGASAALARSQSAGGAGRGGLSSAAGGGGAAPGGGRRRMDAENSVGNGATNVTNAEKSLGNGATDVLGNGALKVLGNGAAKSVGRSANAGGRSAEAAVRSADGGPRTSGEGGGGSEGLLDKTPSDFDAHNFTVVLLYDQRESEKSSVQSYLLQLGVSTEVRMLAAADMLWIARRRGAAPHEGELVLDFCVERKTVKDFAGSLIDGRYEEQKARLSRSGMRHVTYLVEGSLGDQARVPAAALRTAMAMTQQQRGFRVLRTESLAHTAEELRRTHEQIKAQLALGGARAARLLCRDAAGRPVPLARFSDALRKTWSAGAGDVWRRMLRQVSGCSAERAAAFAERYATLRAALEAVEGMGAAEAAELFRDIRPPKGGQGPTAKLRKLWAKLLTEYDYRAEELQG